MNGWLPDWLILCWLVRLGASMALVVEDPGMDARMEIANYNRFMEHIFVQMNDAMKAKQLDPMDLKLQLHNGAATNLPPDRNDTVRAWLHGMSSLRRYGDVSIYLHPDERSIECPFALGPLTLKVSKTHMVNKTKLATAITDVMTGLISVRIDTSRAKLEITQVYFDDPVGPVDIQSSVVGKQRQSQPHYRLVLAAQALQGLKKAARLVSDTQATVILQSKS